MTTMRHRTYEALDDDDDEEAGLFHGEILDLRDVITFRGRSVDELKPALDDSIEDYLAFCTERGEQPENPCSGQFVVRVEPALHRALASSARRAGLGLNKWVARTRQQAAD